MQKFLLLLTCLLASWTLAAQTRTVTGSVEDESGTPLIGVNVLVKGTSTGTVTDFDGRFTLEVPEGRNTLVLSYTGYQSQEVDITSSTNLEIVLAEDIYGLEEIVVVGYSTQKKVNLTGSVEVIEGSEVARQPVFQTSQALVGLAPGLTATQSSGQPGGDGATIRIRGIGTLGSGSKNDPLILVDGIPDNLNGVDPNDIESISVLKDAAAASIYGSRAANGVILITTKRGAAGEVKFNYSNYVGVQEITQNLQFEDGLGYIENFNKAQPGSFDESFINDYRAGKDSNPDQYPDTDWVNELFSETGIQQYHRIAVNGGSENIRVAASISYMNQKGNIPNFEFQRYNGRFNTDIKVSDKFDINFDLNFRRSLNEEPTAGLGLLTRQAYRIAPLFTAVNSDGTYGQGFSERNPIAEVFSGGMRNETFNYFRGVLKANYRPVDGLVVSMTYAPQYNDNLFKSFRAIWEWVDVPSGTSGSEPNQNFLSQSNSRSFQDNFNVIANYDKYLGDHRIGVTAGYEFLKFNGQSFNAFRDNFTLQEFQQLNQGSADNAQNSGSATLNGLQSFFGRINYSFDDRYLLEANLRRDASSRFAKENRVSIFPSFSVGWRISQEAFMASQNLFSDLKLRASWGQLGNQQIGGDFPYQSLFGIGSDNYLFGGSIYTGGSQSVLANRALQWETTETTNVGIDAGFLNNRLTLTAEYYIRQTKDILLEATIPLSTGLNPPFQNVGTVENRGIDLAVDWRNNVGEFSYGVRFNFADVVNEVTDLGGLNELPPGNTIVRVGEPINAIYGYQVLGFFQSQNEIDGAPTHFGQVLPGDLRYEDVNGDGAITADDRLVIGNSIPRKSYGLDLFAGYKGFDLNISFIGVGARDIVLGGDVAYAFSNAGKIQTWQTDSWTPENTDASYPRLFSGTEHNNWRTNSFWVFDASYFRLRNLTLGYTFPETLLSSIFLDDLRIYASGQNLWTIDDMPEGIDPTVPNFTGGGYYPVTSVFTLGLNVSF